MRHVVMCARSKTCKRAPISKRRKTEQVGTLKVPPNPPHPVVSNQHENGPAAPPMLTCNACGSRRSDENRTPELSCARMHDGPTVTPETEIPRDSMQWGQP